jgi:hypothetical protein
VEVHNKVHVAEIFIDLARAFVSQDVTKLHVCGSGGNPGKWFKLYLPNRQSGAVKPDTHTHTHNYTCSY